MADILRSDVNKYNKLKKAESYLATIKVCKDEIASIDGLLADTAPLLALSVAKCQTRKEKAGNLLITTRERLVALKDEIATDDNYSEAEKSEYVDAVTNEV